MVMKKNFMPKTAAELQGELLNLLTPNGFTDTGVKSLHGESMYTRSWTRVDDVAFYGKMESRLTIQTAVVSGSTVVWANGNCGVKEGVRRYSSPKRAYNAIKEIVTYARFEF